MYTVITSYHLVPSVNVEWYQVRAAINKGTLFGLPWETIQNGDYPMVKHIDIGQLSGIKARQQ